MSKILIKNGRVIDPANNINGTKDILISNQKISKVGKSITDKSAKTIDAKGKIVAPGLIDMHVHLREPGREDEETVESGSRAAVKGGFTTIASMPNTEPSVDTVSVVEMIIDKAKEVGLASVLPVAAITKNREGKEISEMADLLNTGAVAFSDDGNPVMNSELMRRALEYSKMFDKPIIIHAEDDTLSERGQMNEGAVSTVLGLKGIPNAAEEVIVARDIILAEEMGGKVHFAHVSSKGSVELIRQAKKRGLDVTCEVTPHHLIFTDEALKGFDTDLKVNPPIRSQEDRKALRKGLSDGTIDAIASDHAPHASFEKDQEFELAPFGMIGLETTLPMLLTELVNKDGISLIKIIEKLTQRPAEILGIEAGNLSEGSKADIVVFDPKAETKVDASSFESKSRNTPFDGWKASGMVDYVIKNGKVVLNKGKIT